MEFSFKAKIYKVGINPCVKVPARITDKLIATKGYIPVKGKIAGHPFIQTLVPVKNESYRLYVNGPMLKGSTTTVGETVKFIIEPGTARQNAPPPMRKEFKKQLETAGLTGAFKKLTPSRQKEILKYMSFLKTEESLLRNIDKIMKALKKREYTLRIP